MSAESNPQNRPFAMASRETRAEEANRLRTTFRIMMGVVVAMAIPMSSYYISGSRSILPLSVPSGAFAGGVIAGLTLRRKGALGGLLVSMSISLPAAFLLQFLPLGEPIPMPNLWLLFAEIDLPVIATISAFGAAGGWLGGRLVE